MKGLKDRVVIVTGGARGIGKAIALAFADEGAKVIVWDVLDTSDVVAELKAKGVSALGMNVDITSLDAVSKAMSEVVEKMGGVDILVNNAGITRDTLIMRMKEDAWDAVLNVNLKGAFNCIKAVLKPMMKKRWGRIINISSIVGLIGNAGQANYSASKAGLIGLTKSAARELAGRNITVNAIAPGFIRTPMTEALSDEVKEAYFARIPLRRFGEPEEVARVVVFLASEDAGYITGEVIRVDGGMAM